MADCAMVVFTGQEMSSSSRSKISIKKAIVQALELYPNWHFHVCSCSDDLFFFRESDHNGQVNTDHLTIDYIDPASILKDFGDCGPEQCRYCNATGLHDFVRHNPQCPKLFQCPWLELQSFSPHSVIEQDFNCMINARYVRFYPKYWQRDPYMRAGVRVRREKATEKQKYEKVANLLNPPNNRTFSSCSKSFKNSELFSDTFWGAWLPNTLTENESYLQIDLGQQYEVVGVTTQGRYYVDADDNPGTPQNIKQHFVGSYQVQVSMNERNWVLMEPIPHKGRDGTLSNEHYEHVCVGNDLKITAIRSKKDCSIDNNFAENLRARRKP